MLLRLDPASAQPIHDQLSAQIRLAIMSGELMPGERLPAARDLADSLEVNVHTVLRAYHSLRDEQLVELRRGRGAIVGRSRPELAEVRGAIEALLAHADAAGLGLESVIALVRQLEVNRQQASRTVVESKRKNPS